MTAASERVVASSARRSAISDAVRRVNVVQLDPELVRVVVHWLGRYSDLTTQRFGCLPDGLADVQYALAEACADDSGEDSRLRELSAAVGHRVLLSEHEHDVRVDTAAAAAQLAIPVDSVRWHCRRGNLDGCRVGRQLMISVSSIENLKSRRAERSA
jgi:hypothetical protein